MILMGLLALCSALCCVLVVVLFLIGGPPSPRRGQRLHGQWPFVVRAINRLWRGARRILGRGSRWPPFDRDVIQQAATNTSKSMANAYAEVLTRDRYEEGYLAGDEVVVSGRLTLICEWCCCETLAPIARQLLRLYLEQQLAVRKVARAALSIHPWLKERQIRRPIFIVGLPRTASTFLHNLMARDPHARTLLRWETERPFLIPGEDAESTRESLLAKHRGTDRFVQWMMPQTHSLVDAMHHVEMDDADEDTMLYGYSGLLPPMMALSDDYYDAIIRDDPRPTLRFTKSLFQAIDARRRCIV